MEKQHWLLRKCAQPSLEAAGKVLPHHGFEAGDVLDTTVVKFLEQGFKCEVIRSKMPCLEMSIASWIADIFLLAGLAWGSSDDIAVYIVGSRDSLRGVG